MDFVTKFEKALRKRHHILMTEVAKIAIEKPATSRSNYETEALIGRFRTEQVRRNPIA